jgi:hypothetical protein
MKPHAQTIVPRRPYVSFLLESSNYDARGYAHLFCEPLDTSSEKPPCFHKCLVQLCGYECIRSKLIGFILEFLQRGIVILSLKDNGLGIVEEDMTQLVK